MSTRAISAKAKEELDALEQLGEVPTYEQARMGERFAAKVKALASIKLQNKEGKEVEDEIARDVMEDMANAGLKRVTVENFAAIIKANKRSSIDKKKLIELGVTATIIAKATDTKMGKEFITINDLNRKRVRRSKKDIQ